MAARVTFCTSHEGGVFTGNLLVIPCQIPSWMLQRTGWWLQEGKRSGAGRMDYSAGGYYEGEWKRDKLTVGDSSTD